VAFMQSLNSLVDGRSQGRIPGLFPTTHGFSVNGVLDEAESHLKEHLRVYTI
jgi:hypothetical protein